MGEGVGETRMSMTLSDGSFVEVMAPMVDVYVDNAPQVVIVMGDEDGTLQEHIDNPRPHEVAESGRDFAGWFNAMTT